MARIMYISAANLLLLLLRKPAVHVSSILQYRSRHSDLGSSGLSISAYKPDAKSENAATHSLRDRPLLLTAKCMALLPVNTRVKD